ncbi:Nuclear polyadenylated RNA-binding protein NAB2 [Pseudocercospora fuligena]|uniref:Nuclear polyadenylated RNA-binding protein NAB2 n=1 Tax=Pseudocercospora fuligena TaxID=685502 RepID=A0A8H6R731_9PEZI|nr:Nuclear polyadenylated RNA-binding protein NAB2 [Pseudocercospora fuligena]
MSGVDPGSALAQQIQLAVQPKLMENGWVAEETDTTLAEYVTMMIVNGKDIQGVQSELGSDLLGLTDDDPTVGEFAQWLFDQVRNMSQPQQTQQAQPEQQEQQPQPIPTVQDAAMEDTPASADAPPTGPKSMRNGNGPQRGRGGRMLGQMNRNMDRSTDLPDNLRRIKGAAGGQSGRINAHSARDGPPRGPKSQQNIANGVQRMMNGGRGGHHNNMGGNMNPMMQGMNGNMNSQQQMQFMQMMEMQANLLTQMMNQNGGQFQNGNHAGRGGRGGHRGGRGGHTQEPKLKAVNGKLPDAALPAGPGGSSHADGMEVDSDAQGSKFSTACRFDLSCNMPDCGFAHHGPATNGKGSLDMEATCTHGAACTNHQCVARHPSPAKKNAFNMQQDCKFFPNCTNPACPFRHPNAPPCRNGADCTTPGCTFGHSKIMCRYNPCLNKNCTFKHAEGQKRGKFEDKVWTAEDSSKADRFAGLEEQTANGEELILPGQNQQENGNAESQPADFQMETQIVT